MMKSKVGEFGIRSVLEQGMHNDDTLQLEHDGDVIKDLCVNGYATCENGEIEDISWLSPFDIVEVYDVDGDNQ